MSLQITRNQIPFAERNPDPQTLLTPKEPKSPMSREQKTVWFATALLKKTFNQCGINKNKQSIKHVIKKTIETVEPLEKNFNLFFELIEDFIKYNAQLSKCIILCRSLFGVKKLKAVLDIFEDAIGEDFQLPSLPSSEIWELKANFIKFMRKYKRWRTITPLSFYGYSISYK